MFEQAGVKVDGGGHNLLDLPMFAQIEIDRQREAARAAPRPHLVVCPNCQHAHVTTSQAGHAKRYGKCYH
jgi:hypothetical protein